VQYNIYIYTCAYIFLKPNFQILIQVCPDMGDTGYPELVNFMGKMMLSTGDEG
jgi:hypothetical protein